MSEQLLNAVYNFLKRNEDPSGFANKFMQRWKEERDDGRLVLDDQRTSEILSSVFCLSDLFNPAADREEYELDVQGLRAAILKLFEVEGA